MTDSPAAVSCQNNQIHLEPFSFSNDLVVGLPSSKDRLSLDCSGCQLGDNDVQIALAFASAFATSSES